MEGTVSSASRLPTGIEPLDRELDGGLPPGCVVAFLAPPASQSELLLYELTAARDTLYLSTDRTVDAVRDAFDSATCPTGEPRIEYVSGDAPLENARSMVRSIAGTANLVIDPGDTLERVDRNRYQHFLNDLSNQMQNANAIAVLHCLKRDPEPDLRPTTEHMADVVLELDQVRAGDELETRLAIPKFRGGRALSETIKLELGERVRVDTSRDIA